MTASTDPYRDGGQTNPMDIVIVIPIQRPAAVALDAATGEERWRVQLPLTANRFVLHRDKILLSSASGEVCAVSMNGELLWHNSLEGLGLGNPMFAVPGVTPTSLS